ncbi:MAG: nitrite/sulfite reductase [Bacilli bacterium]
MGYEKKWADNPNINNVEQKKIEKDGLDIFLDIPRYAKEGFASIPEEQWDLFKWSGLYLQKPKEAGYFMMRVNIPSGIVTNEQLLALATVCEKFGRGVFDITTRQAIQFHWLTIQDIPEIFEILQAAGLSSAGACGDILRTIVGNPLAGLDKDELMDTTQIVDDVYKYFQHNRDFSNLPRKYKMSISSNIYNASNSQINCVSFVPATKEIDGERVVGFHVQVGGGLSSAPHLARTLDVFVKPEEVLDASIAITTIYRDFGYREKRHRTRLKFLIAEWGVEKFADKLREYMPNLLTKGDDENKGWNAGYFYGVHPQKQAGLNWVGFNVPVGRLDVKEVFELARIAKKYGNGEVRTCNSQNIIIANVPDEHVEELLAQPLFERISTNPSSFIAYSVSCTGIEYCNLALVETKEKMRRTAEYLDSKLKVDVPIRMHMVGCPNSCGQRQIADVGIHGVKLRNENREMVEAFELYIGGTLLEEGVFNEKLKGKVPTEQLENVLESLFTYFNETKVEKEPFYDWVHRIGKESIQERYTEILTATV